ncbi:MAG TPA: hypothetical protein ENK98_02860, partial [Epsilonproteobacteria bacterium]|nr:hypothetical protein [Campylobacterota bacterium]
MKEKNHIQEMDYIYFGGANYIFRLSEAIEDLYSLETAGYLAIRGMSSDWIDENLEFLLTSLTLNVEDFNIVGSISEWSQNSLYIIELNEKNLHILKKFFETNKEYYFCAEWISYFKDGEILVDIGHAFDGMNEQLHLSNKLSKHKVKEFEDKKG